MTDRPFGIATPQIAASILSADFGELRTEMDEVLGAGADFFQALTTAVAGALGPLAEIIIDDAVEDLGFTRATFPRDAVASLAERISGEIREPEKRVRFQQTMLQMLRGQQAA